MVETRYGVSLPMHVVDEQIDELEFELEAEK